MAHACHSVGERFETSVLCDFLLNGVFKDSTERMGVLVLCSSLCVRGWIMQLLSGTYDVNGLVWTWERPMLERT